MQQRGGHGRGQRHAADLVADQAGDEGGLLIGAHGGGEAGRRLDDFVERGSRGPGTVLAEAGGDGVDEARVEFLAGVVTEPETRQAGGPDVGDQRIGGGISRRSTAAPSGCFRSSAMLRLLRFAAMNWPLMPRLRNWPEVRQVSPVRVSTLMISAPQSPRVCVPNGPNSTVVRSRMRKPFSGPVGVVIAVRVPGWFCGRIAGEGVGGDRDGGGRDEGVENIDDSIYAVIVVLVVIDTNVFVAGLRSGGGASRQVLRRAVEGTYLPLFSNALWLEYEDVLGSPIWTGETSPDRSSPGAGRACSVGTMGQDLLRMAAQSA